MAWVRTYDIDTPDGSVDDPAEAADRMNEIKLATQERENVDHYWPLTGSEVSDDDAGEHRKITIRTLSAVEVAALTATKAYLYRLVTNGELYFKDDDDNTIQLTSGGKILSASLDMKDEDDMASDSAVHTSTQQAIKAYSDAIAAAAAAAVAAKENTIVTQATASLFGSWTTLDSLGAALVKTEVYKAACDGFVCAYVNSSGPGWNLYGYTDGNNPPTTIRQRANMYLTELQYVAISFPVRKNDYWKITITSGTLKLYWLPIGTGGCVKQ